MYNYPNSVSHKLHALNLLGKLSEIKKHPMSNYYYLMGKVKLFTLIDFII